MIYEIRMTIIFFLGRDGMKKVKSTIIEYIGAKDISSAYLKAGELKRDIMTAIGKTMIDCNEMSISLDAVVAKPEMVSELKIVDIKSQYAFARVWFILNNGAKLMLTNVVLEEILERLKHKPNKCDKCGNDAENEDAILCNKCRNEIMNA